MSSLPVLNPVGEYALLALFFLLFFSLINRSGMFGARRLAVVLALLMVVSLLGSNTWPAIRTVYIYSFALMALLGKFTGTLQAVRRSANQLDDYFPPIKAVILLILAALIMVLEFADILLPPFLQSNVPTMWWRAGAWMIPAFGIATALNDSARTAIHNMFPATNTRMLLFVLVLTAGLLVPIYIPTIDWIMHIVASLGVAIGFVLACRKSNVGG